MGFKKHLKESQKTYRQQVATFKFILGSQLLLLKVLLLVAKFVML
jgi:hypothetical protein